MVKNDLSFKNTSDFHNSEIEPKLKDECSSYKQFETLIRKRFLGHIHSSLTKLIGYFEGFFRITRRKKFFRHWTMSARKTRRPKQSSWSTVMHLAFWRPPQSTPCCFRQNPEEIIDREDRRKLEGCWLEANVSEEFLWCTSNKTYSIQRTSTKGRCCIQR